ncbi:hypothetical protein, partial [Streptomyces boncukensis]|nr:hypothetical protein [Streptomyces boncukensis]
NRGLILEHLEAIGRSAWKLESRERAFEVLGALGPRPEVLGMLERIAGSESLLPTPRIFAVDAYSRAGDPETAERLLRAVLDWMYGLLPLAARVASSLGDSARTAVRDRARRMAEEPEADAFEWSRAAEALLALGPGEDVAGPARRALGDPHAKAHDLKRAADAWLKACGSTAVAEVEALASIPRREAQGRLVVAEALERAGWLDAAARIAGEVLRRGSPRIGDLADAARIWTAVHGAEDGELVLAAIEASGAESGHTLYVPGRLYEALLGAGHDVAEETVAWARGVVASHRWGHSWSGYALSAWLSARGASAVEEIMERTDDGCTLAANDRAVTAEALLAAGARAQARKMAERALRNPGTIRPYYRDAADVLLKTAGEEAMRTLERVWSETPALSYGSHWLNGVLDALDGREDAAADRTRSLLARELVDLPAAGSDDPVRALRTVLEVEGRDAAPYAVGVAKSPRLSWNGACETACELAALRELEAAKEVWRYLLAMPYPPLTGELTLLMDLQAAQVTREAAGWLRELIADPAAYAPRRLRLRQLLAWLDAAEPEPAGSPRASGPAR